MRTRPQRPNILLVISDDHRYSAIGACGDSVVQTPVLDRLIQEGVCFDRNYHFGGLIGAVCVPARACLMTGANPFRALSTTDLRDRVGLQTIRPGMTILPEVLRGAGYFTYHVGKWHNDKRSFFRGFCDGARIFFRGMSDHWHVPVQDFDPTGRFPASDLYVADQFSTDLFTDAAGRFLRQYKREEPFFLYCAYTAPHDPRVPPPDYAALYDPAAIPLPPNYRPEHPFDNGEMRNRDESLAPWPRTPEVARQHIADYYGMITSLDAGIGRLLQTLEETGHAGNTIVVYTADHGLAVAQHGLMGKQNVYEHSLRVPLIVRAPVAGGPGRRGGEAPAGDGGDKTAPLGARLPAGRRVTALTYTADLNPTLCDLAAVDVPATVEGTSLLPLLDGTQERRRDRVYSVYKDVQRAVVEEQWKLIRYYRAGEHSGGTPGVDRLQLFHLADDPWELRDRVNETANVDLVQRLAGALQAWQQQVADPLEGTPVLPVLPVRSS